MPLKLRLSIRVPTVGLGSGGGFRCSRPERLLAVLSKDQQEGRVFSPLAREQRPRSTCDGTLSAQLLEAGLPKAC